MQRESLTGFRVVEDVWGMSGCFVLEVVAAVGDGGGGGCCG